MPVLSAPSVRPARPAELPRLLGMLVDQLPWRELGYNAVRCHSLLQAPGSALQVAADPEDAPIGLLSWHPTAFLGQPYLQLLAVAPQRQRQGVGSHLLAWLEAELFQRQGAANLFLCVSCFNQPARAFYQRWGYTQVGVLTDYLQPGRDELLLRKSRRPRLSPPE